MPSSRPASGLFLIVFFAFAGLAMLYLPPQLAAHYRSAQQLGPGWATAYWIAVSVGGVLLFGALGVGGWTLWRRSLEKKRRRRLREAAPSQLSQDQQQQELEENLQTAEQLQTTDKLAPEVQQELAPLVQKIEEKRQSHTLEIVAFGVISSGKSSLLNALAGREAFLSHVVGGTTTQRKEIPWPGDDKAILADTPGLGEVGGAEHAAISAEAAKDADLILLVVDGPLRQMEFALLEQLRKMEKRVLVCLNKEDWLTPADRDKLLGQLTEQLAAQVPKENVVAIRSRPGKRLRVRISPDGNEVEEEVETPPDITALAERMLRIVQKEGGSLLLANLLLQSRGVVEQAREKAREALDRQAREIIDKYAWSAGGAAALSPLPLVDMAVGCAISSKMVLDLARVYQQKMDAETAIRLLKELGKNLLAIAGISAATPAAAAIAGSMMKTVPGVGTLAGGMLQGVTQAIMTRWIGRVFMAYFREEMQQPEGGLTGLARREWEREMTAESIYQVVKLARKHWKSDQKSSQEAGDE